MCIIVLEGYTDKEELTVLNCENRTGGLLVTEDGCFNLMPIYILLVLFIMN